MATLINIHYTLGDGPSNGPSNSAQSTTAPEVRQIRHAFSPAIDHKIFKDAVGCTQPAFRQTSVDEITLVCDSTYDISSADSGTSEDAEELETLDDYGVRPSLSRNALLG